MNENFTTLYEKSDVEGCFILYDLNRNVYWQYKHRKLDLFYTPASTFKICNSLIGLETGAIKDENHVIKWDGVHRNEIWGRDFDLTQAYKNSTVWYYQELAREVGEKRMKKWVEKAHFGNQNIGGGIDQFWLTGKLRITPRQQVEFLKRLYQNQLPFSQRSMDIVKKIMIEKDTNGIVLRSKTGWGMHGKEDIGWYVGYIEANNNVYFFANCIQKEFKKMTDQESIGFDQSRKKITYEILQELKIVDSNYFSNSLK